MRVALSASHFDIPAVQKLLRGCDVIYTTNVRMRDELWREFGEDRVHFIPNNGETILKYLRELHPDAEFVDYSDIRVEIRRALAENDEKTAHRLARHCGWELYDDYSDGKPVDRWERFDDAGDEMTAYYWAPLSKVPPEVFASMLRGF